jgi:hypothetical protein
MDRSSQTDPPASGDEQDRNLIADIDQYGWHLVGIEQDDDGPGFAYSVGLYRSFGHPEILVIGLAVDVMFGMVNGVGELVRGGKRFEHLDESGDVINGFNVAFRQVQVASYDAYLGCGRLGNDSICCFSCCSTSTGLPVRLSPHGFRVTGITDLLRQGVPLDDVQFLAGHSSPRTTKLYDWRQKRVTRNIVERISI